MAIVVGVGVVIGGVVGVIVGVVGVVLVVAVVVVAVAVVVVVGHMAHRRPDSRELRSTPVKLRGRVEQHRETQPSTSDHFQT